MHVCLFLDYNVNSRVGSRNKPISYYHRGGVLERSVMSEVKSSNVKQIAVERNNLQQLTGDQNDFVGI